MTANLSKWKIRWQEDKTPSMNGHMHIKIWIQNYVARLPKTRKNMMYPIRVKFRRKRSSGGILND